jgi:hypothetical protein
VEQAVDTLFTMRFFTVMNAGSHDFYLGQRPKHLCGGAIPKQKDLRKYEVFKEHLDRSPIRLAFDYKRQMEELGCNSVREFAGRTGRDWSVVGRHLKLLQLPSPIVDSLQNDLTPEILRQCHLKYLVALCNLTEKERLKKFEDEVLGRRCFNK